MKNFKEFVKANKEILYASAKKNTVFNSNGDATISRNDSWFYEDEWDKDYEELVALEETEENCFVLSLKVTSTPPYSEFEIEIFDWADIPLDHRSTVDASSAKLLPKSNFMWRFGRLSDDDWDNVTDLYVSYLKSIGEIE